MKKLLLVLGFAVSLSAQTVRITSKPSGLVSGTLHVPVVATAPVERLELVINGVPWTSTRGQQMTAQVNVGYYIRRLRMRAIGYDAEGKIVGEDEMVVNDPRPPFRVSLQGPTQWPESGAVELHANVLRPAEIAIQGVDFYVGEEKIAIAAMSPYMTAVDAAKFTAPVYARVVARSTRGEEANDVFFFGERAHASTDVTVQQIPVSVADGTTPLRADQLTLVDNGTPRPIDNLVAASDLPLNVILLIDYSESMLEELPVVKTAAKQFARTLLRPQDRIAVVGFNQKTFWLTGWTNDWNGVAQAVDRVQPIGETHLYDSVVEMLYQIQKVPGRHALVVLTDGVDQGSKFKLEHLIHYARYAGVPVYPVVKNKTLSRWMKLGVGRLQARRLDRVADETGATYFIIQKEAELPKVYQRIADELRQQYQLLFYTGSGTADQWHSIRVDTR
ncbi:MAG TPA: VWA domain-containing protein, partial [Thermoanaerobaculia bacterium]